MIIILIEELLLTMFSTTHCNTLQHTAKYSKSLQQQKSPTQLGLSTAGQWGVSYAQFEVIAQWKSEMG